MRFVPHLGTQEEFLYVEVEHFHRLSLGTDHLTLGSILCGGGVEHAYQLVSAWASLRPAKHIVSVLHVQTG